MTAILRAPALRSSPGEIARAVRLDGAECVFLVLVDAAMLLFEVAVTRIPHILSLRRRVQ